MTLEEPGERLPGPGPEVTLRFRPRTLDVHYLTTAELHELAALGVSLHMTFFGVSGGAAVAFAIALVTATLDTRTNAAFVALLAVVAGRSCVRSPRAPTSTGGRASASCDRLPARTGALS